MNENLNLVEILKGCKPGTIFYSPLFGEVIYRNIIEKHTFPINVSYYDNDGKVCIASFCKDGRYLNLGNGECMLFPSKDQRDWNKWKCPKSKFDPNTLQPFDKVLARRGNENYNVWFPDFISDPPNSTNNKTLCMCVMEDIAMVIPYNDDTKYLIGTTEEAPEYYRYWEE